MTARVRIAIIGSGFAGLGMAISLLRDGIDDFVALERSDDLGGTWRDNTYPGCQCDVPSNLYSFIRALQRVARPSSMAHRPKSAHRVG